MFFTRTRIIIIVIVIVAVIVLVGLFLFAGKRISRAEIIFWGVDDLVVWDDLIKEYQSLNPGIKIKYEAINPAVYEETLINALAAGQGPDIFMVENTWLAKHGPKMAPAPDGLVGYGQIQELFPAVVEQDFTANGQIFALPLFLDTLVLLYNQDIFDQRGIAEPPANWPDFQELARQLGFGRTAIGGSSRNIENAPDILLALLLQEGVTEINEQAISPLTFYSKFSNGKSSYFIWDNSRANDFESFLAGEVAMLFGYNYQANFLRRLNPQLRLGIAPLPQSSATLTVNFPAYLGLAVSSQSPSREEAWRFLTGVTLTPQISAQYLQIIQQPPALRSLINQIIDQPLLGIFARQALTARSFFQKDNLLLRRQLNEMIESIMARAEPADVLKRFIQNQNELFRSS